MNYSPYDSKDTTAQWIKSEKEKMKDLRLLDIEETMRDYLIDRGWTPPKVQEEPKPDPLVNLFDGAPVMAKVYHGWLPRYYKSNIEKEYNLYHHGTTSFSMEQLVTFLVDDIRLPTIEESPRNTWLCATPELIEQTEELDCLYWCNNGGFITRKSYGIVDEDVQRFMILEK